MGAGSARWTVEQNVTAEVAFEVLSRDRIANGYALADLEPPFDQFSRVDVARRGDALAACLVLRHPEFNAVVTFGEAAGLTEILERLDLPASTHVGVRPDHRAVFERFYTIADPQERARMSVTGERFTPPAERPVVPERLGTRDLAALVDLYAAYEESFFAPSQIEDGVFYGVRDGDRLTTAGGTHVLAPRAGIAAVGNILRSGTSSRGRRHAGAAMRGRSRPRWWRTSWRAASRM